MHALDALTDAFYRFELRGRGWYGNEHYVMLEPAFAWFRPPLPSAPAADAPRDDGRRRSFLGGLLDQFTGKRAAPSLPVRIEPEIDDDAVPVVLAPERGDWTAFDLRVPPSYVSRPDTGLRLLQALGASEGPLSFEVIGTQGEVHVQLVVGESDIPHVTEALAGYVPEATLVSGADRLIRARDDEQATFVVDFGLSEEFFLPLATAKSFTLDPLIALVNAMALPQEGEFLCFQVLFEKVRNPWRQAVREAVAGPDGTGIFLDAPYFLKAAYEKTASPMFAVALRVGAQAADEVAAKRLASRVENFIQQFGHIEGNSLIPLSNEGYHELSHELAFYLRETYRSGMLLSSEELASLVHLPDASVGQLAFQRAALRSKAAPPDHGTGLIIGTNIHRGVATSVRLSTEERLAHMHVIGASGTGKSNFLLSSVLQDIEAGHGVVVLDPHGDLIDDILVRIPETRLPNVILFDPANAECSVGINILSAETESEREHLASDVVGMFQKLATSWGDSMGSVLTNAVLAIVESKRGGTLLDLRRFLLDDEVRKSYLSEIEDEEIRFFWERSFPLIGTRSIGPILTRLDTFLRSKTMRRVVGVPRSTFDWEEVLSGKRILLAKLSMGLLGEENGGLLGSLLVSQLHQAALRRQRLPKAERHPAFVYCDEFQHFTTPSTASLLSEGRKYATGLVLAHQTLSQTTGNGVEAALLGNAYTRLVFRVSEGDAGKLAAGFSFFESSDLLSLGRGEAIMRLGSAERDCNVATAPPGPALRQAMPRLETPKPTTSLPVPEGPDDKERKDEAAPVHVAQPDPDDPRALLPVVVPKSRLWGAEHKYLAHVVTRLGQERGFKAVSEEPVAGGRVDVALRRADVSVACEISVSTEVTHEVGNARKCLAASFQHVVIVSTDEGKRRRLQKALADGGLAAVLVCAPDELAVFLDTMGRPEPSEKMVRGYKVRVKRQTQTPEEMVKRRAAIGKTIVIPRENR